MVRGLLFKHKAQFYSKSLGTSIAIFGNTSVPDTAQKLPQSFSVIIDGGHPVETSYGNLNAPIPSYQQWYNSPILSNGPHNITLANVFGASIDFAIITVNASSSPSVQQPVIVDDSNLAAITYTGVGWVEDVGNNNFHPLGDVPFNSAVAPYGNSAHLGTRVGDGFLFNFTGNGTWMESNFYDLYIQCSLSTDLTVRGLMDWTTDGSLGLRFTLDGVIQDVALNTSFPQGQLFEGPIQPNYPFYVTPKNLTAGPHTLGAQVLQTTNLSFIFDYITFVPSATPPVTDSVTLQPTDSLSKANLGVIIGGTVGGLALILLAILIFDCVRRRKRQLQSEFCEYFTYL